MNRPVAVTEIHVLAFAGSHCSAFAASDHSPHKLTSEESSCPTELYRARKLLFAVIAFDKTDWFRHRQALSIDTSHLWLSYSDVFGGEATAYGGLRPILRQQASDRPCRRHSVTARSRIIRRSPLLLLTGPGPRPLQFQRRGANGLRSLASQSAGSIASPSRGEITKPRECDRAAEAAGASPSVGGCRAGGEEPSPPQRSRRGC